MALYKKLHYISMCLLAFIAFAPASYSQWITQSFNLKDGWNAVYLNVDALHTSLDEMVGNDDTNPIVEVWRWNPPGPNQFIDNPQKPIESNEWSSWVRNKQNNQLQRLIGNAAYLVRIESEGATYTWNIKGIPVAPRREWTLTGLNFIGFPTVGNSPPNYEAFLAPSPEFETQDPEIYFYDGGPLDNNNPKLLIPSLFRLVKADRGEAYWIRAGEIFNRYFGPFELSLIGSGIMFRDNVSATSFRLKNSTDSTLTVNVMLKASEAPPAGQPTIAGTPPLLIRGELDTTTLSFGYTELPAGVTQSWTLAPRGQAGSEIEVVLGLNRSSITANRGDLLAGVLQFTDSLGHTRMDVAVSAIANSKSGLWLGGAVVNQVQHFLKSYERDTNNELVIGPDGNYNVTGVDTSIGAVRQAVPLRLIVHNPDGGNAVLLQRVYHGLNATTNPVVASGESALANDFLRDARRISSIHLPWTAENTRWEFNGRLGDQPSLTATVSLSHNDPAANPFLHSYHPDHDNLGITFKNALPQGSESYSIKRDITLDVAPPADNFSGLTEAGLTVVGEYKEIITLTGVVRDGGADDTRQFEVRGAFQLHRASDIPTLTIAP